MGKHWLNNPDSKNDLRPPMKLRLPEGPARDEMALVIREAAQYALRTASMKGLYWSDMDPEAIIQSLIVALLGYWTHDGLSSDPQFNPVTIPPIFRGIKVN